MPLRFIQKALQGKRELKDVLSEAAGVFEAYVWSAANLSSGQYGGDYIKLSDVKATTVNGGPSVAGTQTRTLNTEDSDTGGNCTLSSNQFTLAAGTYQIKASAPAYAVGVHKALLYNTTDAAIEIIGVNAIANVASSVGNRSALSGQFIIASAKTFELRHYTAAVKAGNGLGVATSDGTSEIYAIVELWKVK
jgi:hypothetical protein